MIRPAVPAFSAAFRQAFGFKFIRIERVAFGGVAVRGKVGIAVIKFLTFGQGAFRPLPVHSQAS